MFVAKALANRGALIEQCSLSGGENQFLCTVLKTNVLSASAEYILVMANFNDLGRWEFSQYVLRARMIANRFFYIDM